MSKPSVFLPPLRENDVMAVLSLTWGSPSVRPPVFELGPRNLEASLP